MPTPLSIPCPQVIRGCDCVNDPVTNYSSEAPDQPVFFGNYHQPPNAGTYFSPGCVAECTSFVSQEAADECAQRQAAECSFDGTPSDGNPVPDGRGGTFTPRFGNTFQSCDAVCPDGAGTVTALVPPGTVITATQADADARAHSLACQEAERLHVCFSTLSPLAPVCVDEFMSVLFDAYGGTEPYTFAVVAGSIPPGTSLNAEGNLFGTPTVAALYTFTIRVTDSIGTTVTKEFTLRVTIVTPAIPASASVGVPYSQMLVLDGVAGAVTWSLISGSLPDGLSLDAATGIISGTPSVSAATSAFTVEGSLGTLACARALTITVSNDVPCDLGVTDSTSFGDRSINPFIASSESSWGSVPLGQYTIAYTGAGAVEGLVFAADVWSVNSNSIVTGTPLTTYNKEDFGSPSTLNALPVAAYEMSSQDAIDNFGFQSATFQASLGELKLKVRPESAALYISDVGLPTWNLTRVKKPAIDYQPMQLRIADLASLLPSLTPFSGATAGAGTVWDGTMPLFEPNPNFVNYEWRIDDGSGQFQLNSALLDTPAVTKVYHDTAGQSTPTGCAWILAVTYVHPVQGNVVSWVGLGGTGYSPLGTFTFSSDVVGWTMFGKKTAVLAATTTALPANTRTLNVLTADAVGTLPAIDGVALVVADRVLVKNEALAANNGVYVVTSVGSGGTPWVLTRSTDLDTSAEMLRGIFMPVTAGTTLAGSHFRLVTNGPITLNTTPLSFTAIAPTIAVEQY